MNKSGFFDFIVNFGLLALLSIDAVFFVIAILQAASLIIPGFGVALFTWLHRPPVIITLELKL